MSLKGLKVIELAGLAPAPFAGMILADFGANVLRVDRTGVAHTTDVLGRGKRSLQLNLKSSNGAGVLRRLCAKADVLIEPFRCGVMEKLGLGPDVLMSENPGLIYARLTGFGQYGEYAKKAGHDINYLALSGILSCIGRKNEPPLAPVNLLADFAGGGMTTALGIMAAVIERDRTGRGQVIDANMVEGAAYVGSFIFNSQDSFVFNRPRGENILDTGAHFYETYQTKDGKYLSVGAIEPQFYNDLLKGLNVSEEDLPQMSDFSKSKTLLKSKFLEKTRSEWMAIFSDLDACVAPVLEMDEAPEFPHNKERKAFAKTHNGTYAPIPAPRLMNHEKDYPGIVSRRDPDLGEHTTQVLQEAGFSDLEIQQLVKDKDVETRNHKAKL